VKEAISANRKEKSAIWSERREATKKRQKGASKPQRYDSDEETRESVYARRAPDERAQNLLRMLQTGNALICRATRDARCRYSAATCQINPRDPAMKERAPRVQTMQQRCAERRQPGYDTRCANHKRRCATQRFAAAQRFADAASHTRRRRREARRRFIVTLALRDAHRLKIAMAPDRRCPAGDETGKC